MDNQTRPGRLGNPETTLLTDTRLDPRIRTVLEVAGDPFSGVVAPSGVASYETCLEYCAAFERIAADGHPIADAAMPNFETVTSRVEYITGRDGNQVKLVIHEPKTRSGPLPCIVHFHGGGMVLMTAEDPGFRRWRCALAESGMVVIGVEFRNGGGRLGDHPFPAGLNDCASAVQWADASRAALGLNTVVVSGESGGGNLALAVALKAKQEGWIASIDGVYAMCPYISGAYGAPPADLVSLVENDGYTLDCQMMAAMVRVYDPNGSEANNPLAWPYQVTVSELEGLPPHMISVNELDPLRDEGLAYYRMLCRAGVPVVGRTVHGTQHAGDLGFPDITPEIYEETKRSLIGFAVSLSLK